MSEWIGRERRKEGRNEGIGEERKKGRKEGRKEGKRIGKRGKGGGMTFFWKGCISKIKKEKGKREKE